MSQAEYILGFVAIVVGLAVADIAHSLHKLLRARGRVRWHWYPLSTSFLLLLITLEMWWNSTFFERSDIPITIGFFLPWLFGLILLYLLASAALPDEVPAEGIDLRAYYFEQQRYFWILYAALLLFFVVQRIGIAWYIRGPSVLPQVLWNIIPNLLLTALILSLAFIRKDWWHRLWLLVLPVLIFAVLAGKRLT
jgi:hypothetical protein